MQPPNGGTWQGYSLGVIATLLVILLAALGIRKRSYKSRLGTVQGWTSAHIYLGLGVVVVSTLHSAGQLNVNIHSLAYLLLLFVVFSGVFGLYVYTRYPLLLANNNAGKTREQLFAELSQINDKAKDYAAQCEVGVTNAVEMAINRSAIGGGFLAQLFAIDGSKVILPDQANARLQSNNNQQLIIDTIAAKIPKTKKAGHAALLQQLLSLLCRRQAILKQLRRDIQLKAWLQLWLFVHIPATVALLLALTVHIISVFFFW
jgi:hypothetical protein